jgi:hypothetical protein
LIVSGTGLPATVAWTSWSVVAGPVGDEVRVEGEWGLEAARLRTTVPSAAVVGAGMSPEATFTV